MQLLWKLKNSKIRNKDRPIRLGTDRERVCELNDNMRERARERGRQQQLKQKHKSMRTRQIMF